MPAHSRSKNGVASLAYVAGIHVLLAIHTTRSRRVAVEQLNRDAFGCAQEGDARARPHRGGLAGELDALGLELGHDRVDAAHREAEMIEALIGRDRGRVDAVAGRHRRAEHIRAAELEVDARLALLHGAAPPGTENPLKPL